jgi:DNA recombination protein RmuC
MLIEILLILLCLLVVALLILVILFRPRTKNDVAGLPDKIETLQSLLRDDIRQNRNEAAVTAREDRQELNTALKDFRGELVETLKTMTDNNEKGSGQIVKTLEDRIGALITKLEEIGKSARETQASAWKDFTLEQREKLGELKGEQKDLTSKTVAELEKITLKVEQKLTALTDQARGDSNQMREALALAFKEFNEGFTRNIDGFNNHQKERFTGLQEQQGKLIESTEKKLEEMRATVDEKLQKTLNERLGQSFELVGKQLENVQKGLGEMQTLAQDVGGLKKVLSNVRMRGGFGEVQLSLLLEQILAPDQYEANVKTKSGGGELVEFAIKLPGRDDARSVVWIPIDAKFPKDVYEQLQVAHEVGDMAQIDIAQKNLDLTIWKMARDIRDKYIDPPNTTDFAIMFLPFEGIYAEVVRKASLLEQLQMEFKVIVTGPTTLAAILNSLQMGFRSLAIQKRSSEVWQVLGAVKKEFENFGGLLEKAQKNLHTASNQIDEVMGKRTRAIQRKLKGVEALNDTEAQLLLPDATDSFAGDDEPEN